jgi:hypothetical protein
MYLVAEGGATSAQAQVRATLHNRIRQLDHDGTGGQVGGVRGCPRLWSGPVDKGGVQEK